MYRFIFFLLLIFSIPAYTEGQKGTVKDDRVVEWFGEHIVSRIANKGKACTKASGKEAVLLCRGAIFNSGTELKSLTKSLTDIGDNVLEEAVFNDLAKKADFGASCLEKVTSTLLNDPIESKRLSTDFDQTWKEIEPLIQELSAHIQEIKDKRSRLNRIHYSQFFAPKLTFQTIRQQYHNHSNEILEEIKAYTDEITHTEELMNSLFLRLPFADEPSFNATYWKMANHGKSIVDPSSYLKRAIKKVNKQAKKTKKKYEKKRREDGRYKIGHGDKRRLVNFFEPELIIDQAHRSDEERKIIDDGFMCRLKGRYQQGPKAVRFLFDGALIVGSVFTFGVSGVVGAASKSLLTVQKLRKAQVLARGLAVAGTADLIGTTLNQCNEWLVVPKNFKTDSPTCSVEDTLKFQRSKKGYGECVFGLVVGATPLVLSRKLRSLIKNNPRNLFSKVYKPKQIKNLEKGNLDEFVSEYPAIGVSLERGRRAFETKLLPQDEAQKLIDSQIDDLIELNEIAKLPIGKEYFDRYRKLAEKDRFTYTFNTRFQDHIKEFNLSPNELAGIKAVGRKLADKKQFLNFLEEIQADTYQRMRTKGLVAKLEKGELDKDTLVEVLNHRAAKLELSVVNITSEFGEKVSIHPDVLARRFTEDLQKGLLLDTVFKKGNKGESHGVWSHFLQELYTVETFQTAASLKSPQEALNFYKSLAGQEYFRRLKDSVLEFETLQSPEVVKNLLDETSLKVLNE